MSISLPVRGDSALRNIVEGIAIGVVLTALSYAVGLQFGWLDALNYLEVFAVFTSYLCTYLCVMERRINYPIGGLSTAAYCLLFWQYGLLASAAINAFLAVYLLYGWFRWRSDDNTRRVTHMNLPQWAVYAGVAGVGYLIVVFLASAFGGTLAWTDSVILAGTILAQFMLDNKKLENWWVWLLVNFFAIYTYATAGLALAAFQYVFFALNAFYGWHTWRTSMSLVAAINYRDKISAEIVLSDADQDAVQALVSQPAAVVASDNTN